MARSFLLPPLLAGALAVGPALAQTSSVTIYGIVDQGITKANDGTTPASLRPGMAAPGVWSVKAGNTSRLGFRGQEDMGGELYARFHFEHRFAADTGASSSTSVFWLARSVVAVGHKSVGEVYLGREYSPAFWVALSADPTYWSYVSQTGAPFTYANYTAVPASVESSNIRWNNSVGLKTPNLGGFTAEVAAALAEGPARQRNLAGNAQYKSGPVWVGAAFDRQDADNNLALVAGGYDFGVVYPTVIYARAKGGVNGDATSISAAIRVPVGVARVYAMYGSLRPASNLDATMVGLGGEYNLSKRTLLYANLGSSERDGLTRTTAYDLGIKHTF